MTGFWTRRRVQPLTRLLITLRLLSQLPARQLEFEAALVDQVSATFRRQNEQLGLAIREARRARTGGSW